MHKPTVIKIKKQEVKKIKLITPGLKHYATAGNKFLARNDYAHYLRNQQERRDASQRMIMSMYRRSPRSFMMPQYAPESLNYDTPSD